MYSCDLYRQSKYVKRKCCQQNIIFCSCGGGTHCDDGVCGTCGGGCVGGETGRGDGSKLIGFDNKNIDRVQSVEKVAYTSI